MEKKQNSSLMINMIMSAISTSANFIFPLITYAYVARILRAEGTGKVAFAQSVLTYFTYIASLGISSYGIRECSKIRDDKNKLSKLVQELFIINFISTVVAYLLLFITILVVPKFSEYRTLLLLMSTGIILQTVGVEWLYNALEKYTYITIRSLIFKTISVFLTFILIKSKSDYLIYGGITIFAQGASNILNFINARKFIYIKKYNDYHLIKHIIPISLFFSSAIIITVYSQFDTLMLGFLSGDVEVGLYNAAVKIKTMIISISSGLTVVLIPRMTYYCVVDKNKFYNLLKKSLEISLVFIMPLILFVLINTSDVVLFLCGEEYLPAISTIRILVACVIPLILTNLFGNQILVPKGNEKRFTVAVFVGMIINLLLNLVFIPIYGAEGAAFATLITETSNVIIMSYGCRDECKFLTSNFPKKKYITSLMISILIQIIMFNILNSILLFERLVIKTIILFGIYWILLYTNGEAITHLILKTIKNKIKKE